MSRNEFQHLLTPSNEVWDKVICLQVCVFPQGKGVSHGGAWSRGAWSQGGAWTQGVWSQGGAWSRGMSGLRGWSWGVAWSGGGAWSGGMPAIEGLVPGCLVEIPHTATAAGGMYPTGMHSCLNT